MKTSILENRISQLSIEKFRLEHQEPTLATRTQVINLEVTLVRLKGWHRLTPGLNSTYNVEPGIWPGDICGREIERGLCTETIEELEREGGCNCFLGFAPCGYCTAGSSQCVACGWEMESV